MAFQKSDWTVPTPYGSCSWWFLLLTFLATLCFLLSAYKCWFSVSVTEEYNIFVGYWSMENVDMATSAKANGSKDNNYCVKWDKYGKENMFDAPWNLGRALGVMGTLVSLPIVLSSFWMICFTVSSTRFMNFLVYGCVAMSIMAILLLVGLASDICELYNCRLGPGGYFAILDFILWLVAFYFAKQLRFLQQEQQQEDEKNNAWPQPHPQLENTGYDDEHTGYDEEEDRKALPPAEQYPALPPSESSPKKKKKSKVGTEGGEGKGQKKKSTKKNQGKLSSGV